MLFPGAQPRSAGMELGKMSLAILRVIGKCLFCVCVCARVHTPPKGSARILQVQSLEALQKANRK